METEGDKDNSTPSPTDSQQTISDDDEIDYSIKPEFYDSDLDGKDEVWIQKKRKGQHTDAVLSCPCCFTTLCLECQRHEKYVTQYRAVFVVNCTIKNKQPLLQQKRSNKRKKSDESEANAVNGETFRQVCCSVCLTEVGVFDEHEIYHFFNALPSES